MSLEITMDACCPLFWSVDCISIRNTSSLVW
jgi:hypothetical protein